MEKIKNKKYSRTDSVILGIGFTGSLTVEYKKDACRPYKTCFFYVKFLDFIPVILCYCVL